MRKFFLGLAAAALAIGIAAPACAAEVTVSDGWFRALPSGLPAGGYFSLHNGGSKPVALVGAKSSACGMLMLHQSTEQNGVSRMIAVHSVAIPVGGTIAFAPGGYHLMCTNPTAAMTPGKTVRVTLIFADGDRLNVAFAAKGPSGE